MNCLIGPCCIKLTNVGRVALLGSIGHDAVPNPVAYLLLVYRLVYGFDIYVICFNIIYLESPLC